MADDVVAELSGVRDKLYAAGVLPEQIIIDPGIGFSKTDEQNWELLGNLDRLEAMGHKVLVGRLAQALPGHPADRGRQGRAPGGARRRHRRHHGHQPPPAAPGLCACTTSAPAWTLSRSPPAWAHRRPGR